MTVLDRDWVNAYAEAWSAPDSEALMAFFAPDGLYEDTGSKIAVRGPAQVGSFADFMRRFAADSLIEFGPVVGSADGFFMEWTWSGTATGPLMLDGVVYPATGEHFSVDGVALCAVDADGLLTRHTDIYDMRATLRACGIQEVDPTTRTLVDRVYPALGAGDADTLRAVLAEDFRGVVSAGMPAGSGMHEGPDAMIGAWWAMGRAYDVAAEVEELVACADGRLLVTGTYRGTSRASGDVIDAAFTHLWAAQDGRLTTLSQVTDTVRWVA